jgi:hypothetical protein
MASSLESFEKFLSHPILWGVLALIALAVALSGKLSMSAASWLMWAAFALAIFGVYRATADARIDTLLRLLIIGCAAFGLALGVVLVNRWINSPKPEDDANHTRPNSPASVSPAQPTSLPPASPHLEPTPKPESTLPGILFPVIVKLNLYPWRVLRIENKGRVTINDISLSVAKFSLDKESYTQKRVVIQSSTFPLTADNGAILLTKSVRSGGHFETEVKRFLALGHNTFEESLKNPNIETFEYGARVTFRDSQTGQKYACYKVFSSIDGEPEPWSDMTSTTGAQSRIAWMLDVPQKIIAAMKDHYQDGAIDLQCER